jgi:hypothetical protein
MLRFMGDLLKLIWWMLNGFLGHEPRSRRDPDASPPAQFAAKKSAEAACFQQF